MRRSSHQSVRFADLNTDEKIARIAMQLAISPSDISSAITFSHFVNRQIIVRKEDPLHFMLLTHGAVSYLTEKTTFSYKVDKRTIQNCHSIQSFPYKILCFTELINNRTADNTIISLSPDTEIAILTGHAKQAAITSTKAKHDRLKAFFSSFFQKPISSSQILNTFMCFKEIHKPGKVLIVEEGNLTSSLIILVEGVITYSKQVKQKGRYKRVDITTIAHPGEVISNPFKYGKYQYTVISSTQVKLLVLPQDYLHVMSKSWVEKINDSQPNFQVFREQRFCKNKDIFLNSRSEPSIDLSNDNIFAKLQLIKNRSLIKGYSVQDNNLKSRMPKVTIDNVLDICNRQKNYKIAKRREMRLGLRKIRLHPKIERYGAELKNFLQEASLVDHQEARSQAFSNIREHLLK